MFEKVPLKTTYIRESGIHAVKNGERTDYLTSFPDWNQLAENLKSDLPTASNSLIITPELITVDSLNTHSNLDSIRQEIEDRVEYVKDLSKQTEAGILLGTPTRQWIPGDAVTPGRSAWRNSALHIRNGEIISADHKSYILPVEEDAGIEATKRVHRQTKLGKTAVLICAELYGLDYRNQPMLRQMTQEAIALTSWATPIDNTKQNTLPISEQDWYYKDSLENAVEQSTFPGLPNLDRLTIVDRGTNDIPPYNAVFERVG